MKINTRININMIRTYKKVVLPCLLGFTRWEKQNNENKNKKQNNENKNKQKNMKQNIENKNKKQNNESKDKNKKKIHNKKQKNQKKIFDRERNSY